MPNPKRRHSQQRSAKRRTHYKAKAATLSTDGQRVKHTYVIVLTGAKESYTTKADW